MTICGGIIIGGDSSRNKRWPHKADLRRLSLRFSKARAEKTPKVSIVLEEESYYQAKSGGQKHRRRIVWAGRPVT
ncbi:MAG: hypothetical protein ACSW79_00675 [Eubacteriales bacterium]|jgi:hypothetical protein